MAKDFIAVGTTPCAEPCVQVGQINYAEQARLELAAYAMQITMHYPAPNEKARLVIRRNAHDFGTYYDLLAVFDDEDEASAEWAYSVDGDEKDCLVGWDPEILKNLIDMGYEYKGQTAPAQAATQETGDDQ